MKKIYLLTDYKGFFGSKWKSIPYRSGYDQQKLKDYFYKYNYDIEFISFTEIDFDPEFWKDKLVLYTSSEEYDLHYKSFIEDVILGLSTAGAIVMPGYINLRANNNKVFMEIMRKFTLNNPVVNLHSQVFGTYRELEKAVNKKNVKTPCILKPFSGSMSRGVSLVKNEKELLSTAAKLSRTKNIRNEIHEIIRSQKRKGYVKESAHQNRFIVQPFIPNLKNDWKVLIYGDHYFILKRHIKPNDFRASGSGLNYLAGSESEFPIHMLDELEKVYHQMDVPHASIDFAYDGEKGYIFEFQFIYFGTSTQYKSKDFYQKENGKWLVKEKTFDQEEEYVWGVDHYLKNNSELGS